MCNTTRDGQSPQHVPDRGQEATSTIAVAARPRPAPDEDHASGDHSPRTREIIHVHQGTLIVTVDGTDHPVAEGRTIDFRADRSRAYRNPGTVEAVLLMVVAMPEGEHDRRPPTTS